MQVGTVMQVIVSKMNGEDVEVRLKAPGDANTRSSQGIRNDMMKPPTARYSIETTNSYSSMARSTEQTSRPSQKTVPPKAPAPAGIDLKTLKTGMKLEGTVAFCTPYAAFIDVDVYRASKGATYSPVNGLLQETDLMNKYTLQATKNRRPTTVNAFTRGALPPLERGMRVTVYVKEVLNNAG